MYGLDDLALVDEEKRRPLVADGPIELDEYFGASFANRHAFHSKGACRVGLGRLGMRLNAQQAQNGKSNFSEMSPTMTASSEWVRHTNVDKGGGANRPLDGIKDIPGGTGPAAMGPER